MAVTKRMPPRQKLTTTYADASRLNMILSETSNPRELSVDSMFKLLDLKRELENATGKYQDVLGKIMEQYGIKMDRNQYTWNKHKDSKAISAKVEELLKTEVKFDNLNFLNKEEFKIILPAGVNLGDISYLSSFLLTKD